MATKVLSSLEFNGNAFLGRYGIAFFVLHVPQRQRNFFLQQGHWQRILPQERQGNGRPGQAVYLPL